MVLSDSTLIFRESFFGQSETVDKKRYGESLEKELWGRGWLCMNLFRMFLPYFEVLSRRSLSIIYFQSAWLVDRSKLGICVLSIPGIFVLHFSEGGRGERKSPGTSASFVVLGSSPLLGNLQVT